MREKTVGLVAPLPPQVGGVAGFAEWLLAHEGDIGYRFEAFDLWRPPAGGAGGRLSLGSVAIQARVFPAFLRWLRRAPGVVHYSVSHTATGLTRDTLFLSALRMSRRRVVGHIHVIPEASATRAGTLRALDRLVDKWVTLAPSSVAALDRLGIDAEWIPNPIRISPNGQVPEPTDGPLRLLFVGRYGERKGCPELVDALALVRDSGADVTLRFVGREEYAGEEGALRRDVAARGLEDAVEFAGVLQGHDLATAYAASDALCLPSRREGVPLVVLEAMAFGLPVIATRVGGIPDFVDAENGLLVPPGDVRALADSIRSLAGDRALGSKLGGAGRERVARIARDETIAARWAEVYAEMGA